MFDSFGLLEKVIAYVKTKGSNFSTLIITLTNIFFGHHFSYHAHSKGPNLVMLCQRHVSMPLMMS